MTTPDRGPVGDSGSSGNGGSLPPAIVVGLDNITGLQTARILAGHGVPVYGVVANTRHFGARTRVCVRVIGSEFSDAGLVTTLRRLDREIGTDSVLFPCSDVAVNALSSRRGHLPARMVLPMADHDVISLLMDKSRFGTYAEQQGLPVPRTLVLGSRAAAEDAARTLVFPCVVKPPVTNPTWRANAGAKGYPVATAAELLEVYDRVADWAPSLVAQEWIEGGEEALLSCNAYFDSEAEPLVTFTARKVRQWPPKIGTSASGVEIRDDELRDLTVQLFQGIGFHGLAYLEAKRDVRTGRLAIIEPNVGRPTGRSAIAEAGGVELVFTAYCSALGRPLPTARRQQYVGAKWLDLRRDAQAALAARRRGELGLTEWLASLRGAKAHAIWAPHDRRPFVTDLLHATGEGLRRASSRSSSGSSSHPVAASDRVPETAVGPVP